MNIFFTLLIFTLPNSFEAEENMKIEYQHQLYYDQPTQKSIYLRFGQDSRKNNKFNYDYEDWEETEKNILDFVLTTTLNANTTTDNNNSINTINDSNTTSVLQTDSVPATTLTETTNFKEPTNDDVINKTTTEEITSAFPIPNDTKAEPILKEVETTTVVLNSTTEDTDDFIQKLQTTSSSESVSPPPFSFYEYFPGTTNVLNFSISYTTTTKDPLLEEIKELNKKEGQFTSSLIVLLRLLSAKNPKDTRRLLITTNSEIERLSAQESLGVFEGTFSEVFQALVQMLALEPLDVLQNHLKYAVYALEYRRSILKLDVNTVLDVADTIINVDDTNDIAKALNKVNTYPNNTEPARKIVDELLHAFILRPILRNKGSIREKVLLEELNKVIKKRLYPGDVRRFLRRKDKSRKSRTVKFKIHGNIKNINTLFQNNHKTRSKNITNIIDKHKKNYNANDGDAKTNFYLNKKIARSKSYSMEKGDGDNKEIINLENSKKESSSCSSESNADSCSSDLSDFDGSKPNLY